MAQWLSLSSLEPQTQAWTRGPEQFLKNFSYYCYHCRLEMRNWQWSYHCRFWELTVIVLVNSHINIPIPPKSNWHEIFFASMYSPIQDLRFFWSFLILLYFPLCYMRQKRATYMLGTLEFCIHMDQNLIPRPHETLWKSLAPFRMIFGVNPVQPLINRWYRAENQLNRRKYQTIPEKSQTWCFPHPWHVRA
jgi:hypothetical protein